MDFESDSPGVFSDWNVDDVLDNLSTLLPFDSHHAGLHDANFTIESFNFESPQTLNFEDQVTELAAAPTPAEGLMLEGAGHDMTQTGYFNQFSDIQNGSVLALQGIGVSGEHTPNNPTLVPNIIENNNFSGINNQSSHYPALLSNPVQARPGIETGHSSGQFVTNQRPELCPPHSHISNSHAAWSSRWPEHNQFSAPNVHGSQYATNYPQSPQSSTTLQNQVGHASEMQKIFDLQSQNSMRPHPNSSLQSAFVTMPPNPYQQGYRPVLPEPAAPSASSLANYGQQPSLFATTSNSFGSKSSVPPTYPPLYENQGNHHPQVMMPNGQGQQSGASVQLWSQGVPNQINEHNRRMNTPNLKWRSNTLHEPTSQSSSFTSSKALSSTRILGLSSTRATEGLSLQVSNSREADIARHLRAQPSEAIRRILNMNPTRTVTPNAPIPTQQNRSGSLQIGRGTRTYDLGKQLQSLREGRYEPPRRGRPPKRRDAEESSSQRGKRVSSETGKAATPTSQEARMTPDSVVNRVQNPIPTNPSFAPGRLCSSKPHFSAALSLPLLSAFNSHNLRVQKKRKIFMV
ncbi:heat shock protein [Spatholobus suberectus]|nr:heat shock protein [Spatholobus suberectus]